MTTYQNRYRVETTRMAGWDYGSPGFYFVTICTAQRRCFFGDVVNGVMVLSPIGEVARDEWLRSAQLRQNVALDAFVIMPNHHHGIVQILPGNDAHDNTDTRGGDTVETRCGAPSPGGVVETRCGASLPRKFGPLQSGSLAALVNAYKGAVTRWCKKNGFVEFAWQARFWDRVIRTERELNAVRAYIENNPRKWALDQNNQEGVWV